MVRHRLPAISSRASGTLADTLTYSTWKGKPYSRRRSKPKDPLTPAQYSARAFTRWLITEWSILSDTGQASWDAHPDRKTLSRYHCYLKLNMQRWFHGHPPIQTYPPTPIPPPPGPPTLDSATPEVRQIDIELGPGAVYNYFVMCLHRSTTDPCTPSPKNLRIVRHYPSGDNHFIDEAETGVPYYYAARGANPTAMFGQAINFGPLTAL